MSSTDAGGTSVKRPLEDVSNVSSRPVKKRGFVPPRPRNPVPSASGEKTEEKCTTPKTAPAAVNLRQVSPTKAETIYFKYVLRIDSWMVCDCV